MCVPGRDAALEEDDLRGYPTNLGLEVTRFDGDRRDADALERVRRDVSSALASGEVHGTPTVFIDGVVLRGGYDVPSLLAELAG